MSFFFSADIFSTLRGIFTLNYLICEEPILPLYCSYCDTGLHIFSEDSGWPLHPWQAIKENSAIAEWKKDIFDSLDLTSKVSPKHLRRNVRQPNLPRAPIKNIFDYFAGCDQHSVSNFRLKICFKDFFMTSIKDF